MSHMHNFHKLYVCTGVKYWKTPLQLAPIPHTHMSMHPVILQEIYGI